MPLDVLSPSARAITSRPFMTHSPWLRYALFTTVTWGIWGAFTGLPSEHGFPDTLTYVVWALVMLLPAAVVLKKTTGGRLSRRPFDRAWLGHRSVRRRRPVVAVSCGDARTHLPDFSHRLALPHRDRRVVGGPAATSARVGLASPESFWRCCRCRYSIIRPSRGRTRMGCGSFCRSASWLRGACRPTS